MSEVSQFIDCFGHDSECYSERFELFLQSTDQKVQIRKWLEGMLGTVGRNLFIDAGAGDGSLTALIANDFKFQSTVAIEPDKRFEASLLAKCPNATIVASTIGDAFADSVPNADFVLCSHVLYYVPHDKWVDTVKALTRWLAPCTGVLALVLQHPDSDCSRMSREFSGEGCISGEKRSLALLAAEFLARYRSRQKLSIDTISATVEVDDLGKAYLVAEFLLQSLPVETKRTVKRERLRDYISRNFFDAKTQRFCFSVDQDVLTVTSGVAIGGRVD